MIFSDRTAIWFLAFGQTLVWAGTYYIFPALIIRWETDLGWNRSEITGALTIAIFASAIFSPVSGRLIDKGFGAQTLTLGAFVGGWLVAALFFVKSLTMFYIIWAGLGICMAFALYEPCFAFVIRTKGLEAKKFITLITLVAGFASTLSFPIAHVLSDAYGWRISLVAFVIMVSFVGAPLMWFGARNLTEHSSALQSIEETALLQGRGRYGFLAWPKFWYIALSMTLLAMVHATLINHLLLLLKDRQISADTAVLAASFMGPMQVFGRIAASLVGRYFSNGIITTLCFVFSISAVGALILAEHIPVMLAVFIILQGSGIGISSIMKPVLSREILGGENFGLKSGAQAVPFFIGNAFAALIGSLLWMVGGYDLVLQVLIVLLVIGLGSLILAMRANRKTS